MPYSGKREVEKVGMLPVSAVAIVHWDQYVIFTSPTPTVYAVLKCKLVKRGYQLKTKFQFILINSVKNIQVREIGFTKG